MIHLTRRNSIATLTIEHGKVNTLDAEILEEFVEKLNEIRESSAAALIITGAGSTFSAGVDLFRVRDGGQDYLDRFLPILTDILLQLFMFPRPVVAAANGHAIAGGCLLVCAGDYRIMAKDSGRIGAPELLVGVPFPALPLEILRFVVPMPYFQEVIYSGKTYSADEALARGLVDEVADQGALMDRANEMAQHFAAIPPQAFQITKRLTRQPTIDRFQKYEKQIAPEIAKVWASKETYAAIDQYLKRTIGKGK